MTFTKQTRTKIFFILCMMALPWFLAGLVIAFMALIALVGQGLAFLIGSSILLGAFFAWAVFMVAE